MRPRLAQSEVGLVPIFCSLAVALREIFQPPHLSTNCLMLGAARREDLRGRARNFERGDKALARLNIGIVGDFPLDHLQSRASCLQIREGPFQSCKPVGGFARCGLSDIDTFPRIVLAPTLLSRRRPIPPELLVDPGPDAFVRRTAHDRADLRFEGRPDRIADDLPGRCDGDGIRLRHPEET